MGSVYPTSRPVTVTGLSGGTALEGWLAQSLSQPFAPSTRRPPGSWSSADQKLLQAAIEATRKQKQGLRPLRRPIKPFGRKPPHIPKPLEVGADIASKLGGNLGLAGKVASGLISLYKLSEGSGGEIDDSALISSGTSVIYGDCLSIAPYDTINLGSEYCGPLTESTKGYGPWPGIPGRHKVRTNHGFGAFGEGWRVTYMLYDESGAPTDIRLRRIVDVFGSGNPWGLPDGENLTAPENVGISTGDSPELWSYADTSPVKVAPWNEKSPWVQRGPSTRTKFQREDPPWEPPSKPGRGTKEKKVFMAIPPWLGSVLNVVTESLDVLQCLHKSLPKKFRAKPQRIKPGETDHGGPNDAPQVGNSSGWRAPTPQEMANALYQHWDAVDPLAVIECIISNNQEDKWFGVLGGHLKESNKKKPGLTGYGFGPAIR